MPAIPSALIQRLRDALAQHPALESDRALRAVFIDARLALWRNRVPENTADRAARVNALIAVLCDQATAQGESALTLCLHTLAEQTAAADALHAALTTLAAALAAYPPAELAALKPPAPAASVTVTNAQVGGIGDNWHVEGGIHQHKHFHPAPPPINERERRNREAMLQLVRNTWIEGVLEQSLHGAAMLELSKDYTPEAVKRPWDMELHMPGQERRPVPHGTPILEVFDQCSGALLILGEPGSGKTTTLLELARAAIERAEQDETRHIPVVFNLSSWAVKQAPLEGWLLDELRTKYQIPRRIARPWIEGDHLLLLLDGLDEVKADARDKCVAAINAYREEHLVLLAVCSRTADYEALAARLHLRGAIGLRPLTPTQIDAYLAGAGTELRAVRATLQHDPVLQEMAQSPLMLSVMALAYRGLEVEELQMLATPETRRQHLFDTYVERMLQRRSKEQPYTETQSLHWLSWLAQQMTEQKQSMFFIEDLQPQWLPENENQSAYRLAVLICGFIWGMTVGLGRALWMGPVSGLFKGFQSVSFFIVAGAGLENFFHSLRKKLIDWLFLGRGKVKLAELLIWSWEKAFIGLKWGLLIGVCVGATTTLILELFDNDPTYRILTLIFYVTYWGISGTIIGMIIGGITTRKMSSKTSPNQGVHQSFKNALGGALIGGVIQRLLFVELFLMLIAFLTKTQFMGRLDYIPAFGLAFGFLFLGGGAVIFHYSLRIILARTRCAPWNYVRFLDYCAYRIFLRKVGGGYIFIHRLLQEYFAKLETVPSPEKKLLTRVRELPRSKKRLFLAVITFSTIVLLAIMPMVSRYFIADVYYVIGKNQSCGDKEALGLQNLSRAAELAPYNSKYWSLLCWQSSLIDDPMRALTFCEQGINLHPGNGEIISSRGLCRALIGDSEGAIEDFRTYIHWAKTNPFAFQSGVEIAIREKLIFDLESGEETIHPLMCDILRMWPCISRTELLPY